MSALLVHVYLIGASATLAAGAGFFVARARARLVFPAVSRWRVAFALAAFALAWPLSIPALFLLPEDGEADG